MIAYFDTSALVKRYLAEQDAEEIAALWAEAKYDTVSRLAYAETLSALHRKESGRNWDDGLPRPEPRKRVNDCIEQQALPERPDPDLIPALCGALSRRWKVSVKMEDLHPALLGGSSPATPVEMKRGFEECLDELTKGKEPGKVRVVLG